MKVRSIQSLLVMIAAAFALSACGGSDDSAPADEPSMMEKAADAASDAADAVGEAASDAADAAGEMAGDAMDAAGDAVDAAGDMAGDAMDAAGEMASDAMDAAGDAASAAGEMAGDAMDAAGDMAGDAMDAAGDMAGDAMDAAGDMAGDAMDAAKGAAASAGAAATAMADDVMGGSASGDCALTVEVGDALAFSTSSMSAPASCDEVSVTITHTGSLPASAMGHNWVLLPKDAIEGVATEGMGAGLGGNYIKEGEDRIVVGSKIVGGGESDTVTFKPADLDAGTEYMYICTFPGHWSVMRGTFTLT
ncbi:MAG: azurin [Pseudomonadota bacterium]